MCIRDRSRSLSPNSQFVTRFDCHAAVSLPDDVQECLWSQEATGKAWIGLEQNIIDTAVNEWRKHLHVSVCIIGLHFQQFYCRQFKNEQLNKMSAKVSEMWTQCFYVLCWLSRLIIPHWIKNNISLVLFFPGSAETDTGWVEKLKRHLMASCLRNICTKNYWNPIILFEVTIENVRDVFFWGGGTRCTKQLM